MINQYSLSTLPFGPTGFWEALNMMSRILKVNLYLTGNDLTVSSTAESIVIQQLNWQWQKWRNNVLFDRQPCHLRNLWTCAVQAWPQSNFKHEMYLIILHSPPPPPPHLPTQNVSKRNTCDCTHFCDHELCLDTYLSHLNEMVTWKLQCNDI